MDDYTSAIKVKLASSRVFLCEESFGEDTPRYISQLGQQQIRDWVSCGCVAVSRDTEAGSDMFFSLRNAYNDTGVVFADQRRTQLGQFEPHHVAEYLGKLAHCPTFLKANGARLVRGITYCVSLAVLSSDSVPRDCFIVSRKQEQAFYATLAIHPACSWVLSLRSRALSFRLPGVRTDRVANATAKKRKRSQDRLTNCEESGGSF